MFKSVLIIVVVVVLLVLIRSVLQRFKLSTTKSTPIDSRDTVQCLQCKTYIPREDAIINGNNTFCSTQHLEDWNQSA